MMKQEDTRRRSRRDLLLILLILPFGILCMFMTGQVAVKLAPTWLLPSNMFSNLDPNADFAGLGNPLYIEPLNPAILTQPAWDKLFLTPNAIIPTRAVVVESTPVPPPRTPLPPPVVNTPEEPPPTATSVGPIIIPTKSIPQLADLAITKTDSSNTYTPGTPINYTIVVRNNGPDPAPRFNVSDNIPTVITGLVLNCTPASRCGTNTSSGNTVSFSDAALYAGEQITITVSGSVAPSATGNLSNTAQVTVPPRSGYSDANLTNNTITDTDTLYAVSDLAITKTSPSNTYTADNPATNPITYTVIVTNNSGPSDAQGVRVVDNKPSQIESWDWQCTTVFNASGCNGVTGSTSNFTDNGIRIQVGGRVEYTVTAYLPANAYLNPSDIVNTARVLLSGSPSYVDLNPLNDSSTVTTSPNIDLEITKTDSGAAYAPNGTIPYTVTVTNNSTFNLTNIEVSDLIPTPAQVLNWTWTCPTVNPNPSCSGVTNSNADFTDAIDLTAALTTGASLTYNVSATVSGAPGLGGITNTATVDVDPLSGLTDADTTNNSASVTTPPYIDLQITKDDGVATYIPGGNLTYTVTVTNNSAFDLSGIPVTDTMPALISSWSWTCAPDPGPPGSTCTAGPSVTNINDTVTILANRSIIYTIDAVVSSTATGDLTNTATVSSGYTDAVPGDNTAMDTDSRYVEYVSGPPDGAAPNLGSGNSIVYTLTTPITIDGNSDYEIVYYERNLGDDTIDLDWVIIQISNDMATWYTVYYWGDNLVDTNALPPGQTTELDNTNISSTFLYGTPPLQTGILIDADGSTSYPRPPNGTYQYIRVTAPAGDPTNDGCDIDTIEVWP